MSIKAFLAKVFKAIGQFFRDLNDETKVLVPKAYIVLENIKSYVDSGEADVLVSLTKGVADNQALAILREWLPKLLNVLFDVEEITSIADPNERMKAILAKMHIGADEAKKMWYRGLVAMILEKLSDGVFDSADAAQVMEYYFQHRGDPEMIALAQKAGI